MAGRDKPKGGRKKDKRYWNQFDILEDGRKLKCKNCEHEFSGSGTRIRAHLLGETNQGVKACKPEVIEKFIKWEETRNLEDPPNLCSGSLILDMVSNYKNHKEIMHSSEVGPFSVLKEVDIYEALLIDYVFNSSLDQSEIIFKFRHSHLNRSEFTTLRPQSLLDSLVIDIFAEYMTNIERKKKNGLLNWYLPLTFSTSALQCRDVSSFINFVTSQKIREKHMSNLKICDKMFIPVHIGENSCGHFYLYAIHLRNGEVEIWDSLPEFTHEKEREEITQKLLVALDKLFEGDIGNNGMAFTKFRVAMAKDTPIQPNRYDCGMFVIKFMQQSADVMRDPSFEFHSDQERLDLALQLLKCDINEERLPLIHKATEPESLRRQSGTEDGHLSGIKRKDHNISTAVSEEVEKRTSAPFNDSSSGKRLKCSDNLGGAKENLDTSDSPKGHTKGLPLPTSPNLIVEMLEEDMEQVLQWLMKDEVSVIGVCGMGGVGKTTLATYIHNQLLERDYGFDHVIWVTVSHDYSILQMQKEIAKSIDTDISGEVRENKVAARLLCAFPQMKKCVIILDDACHHIFLEQVGIPVSDNGIKLILTTRSKAWIAKRI